MRAARFSAPLALALLAAGPVWSQWNPAAIEKQETCRIRIANRAKGLVQVSLDSGRTYWTVGRVRVPANARIAGFAAASYIPRGTVAAVAVHGIRIKTGQAALGIGKAQQPLMFSITPVEFSVVPRRYGGHKARSAQIVTDIHAGRSIFRNQSPYVGSPVFIERDGSLISLPEDYVPTGGETFVIVAERPTSLPGEIVFENRAGGSVTAHWRDGKAERLTSVVRPVKGVGRYDGTTFTGTGFVNTNHGGVITIGTAPLCPPGTKEGGQVETRGGFMIQPSYHVREQQEAAPQVMVVGQAGARAPELEGTPPMFRGYINLSRLAGRPDGSCCAEVRIDDGGWEPPPSLVGKLDNAFTASALENHFLAIGKPRKVTSGVTAIRLLFAEPDAAALAEDLAKESAECARAAAPQGFTPAKGILTLVPTKSPASGSTVLYWVDGAMSKASNRPPYSFDWDTSKAPNGLHEILIEVRSGSGQSLRESRTVLVRN